MERRPREQQKAERFIFIPEGAESLEVDWGDSICQCNLALVGDDEWVRCTSGWPRIRVQ